MKVNTQALLRAGEEMRVQLFRMEALVQGLSEAEVRLRGSTSVLEPHIQALREQRLNVERELESLRRAAEVLEQIARTYEDCERRLVRDAAQNRSAPTHRPGRLPRPQRGSAERFVSPGELEELVRALILPLMAQS